MAEGPDPAPRQSAQVFAAEDVFVCHGVNQGDGLAGPDAVALADLYQLDPEAQALRLVLWAPDGGVQRVAGTSQIGQPDAEAKLAARYTLMAPDGERVEALLVELGQTRAVLPLSPLAAGVSYALVALDAAPGDLRLSDLLCLSFARGTMITRGDGTQAAVESLVPGQDILTRDHGRCPLRWIGQTRLRAAGAFAPVVISAGTMGNTGDLILGPHHRVFLYQRGRRPGMTSDLLVQARHLVDGARIYVREGGWTDYFSLVFDRHEIIYAEGVPSESLLVTEAVVSRLPPDVAADVQAHFPGLAQVQHFGAEAGRQALQTITPDPIARARARGRGQA